MSEMSANELRTMAYETIENEVEKGNLVACIGYLIIDHLHGCLIGFDVDPEQTEGLVPTLQGIRDKM